jgi:hypothetical protein
MVHIKQPGLEASSFSHILSPFVSTLWGVVVSTIVVLALFLSATWCMNPTHSVSADVTSYSVCESWLYVFGAFCQQGTQRV